MTPVLAAALAFSVGLSATSPAPALPQYARGYVRSARRAVAVPPPPPALPPKSELELLRDLPDDVDWSGNATTKVRDQGACNSSWAYATIAGVESSLFMQSGALPAPLSTEELVACDAFGANAGCAGGDIPPALDFLKENQVTTDEQYPDDSSRSGATPKMCAWAPGIGVVANVSAYIAAVPRCDQGDCSNKHQELLLAAALVEHGPISVCVNSGMNQQGSEWDKDYKGGVLQKPGLARANLIDHCVQLVGFDRKADPPYWKLRNSWGTRWGEGGFIRIPFMDANACCITCEAFRINAVPLPPPPPSLPT
jgi:cysteine peptidase B